MSLNNSEIEFLREMLANEYNVGSKFSKDRMSHIYAKLSKMAQKAPSAVKITTKKESFTDLF